MNEPTMNVAGLIAELQKLDQTMEIWADGCDCINRVVSLEVNSSRPNERLYLNRRHVVRLHIDENQPEPYSQ